VELFRLYEWAILGGVSAAMALGLLGAWLAARDRAMQTLCLGQGATLGVLVGLGLLPMTGAEGEPGHFFPFMTAVLFSAATYWLSEQMIRGRSASKNTFYSFLFATLLALAYLVSALFPALESHMAQVFFGDLATLSNHDALKTLALSVVGMGVLLYRWRAFSNQAFESAIFGVGRQERARKGRNLFRGISFVAICFSVQYLGFLFTMACLFVPTSVVSFLGGLGLRRHLFLSSALATLATFAGFVVSLSATRLPTVPTIVVLMLLLSPLCLLARVPKGR
jgi:ABC-type Mn2+/Zn2+ transport system permease subunit